MPFLWIPATFSGALRVLFHARRVNGAFFALRSSLSKQRPTQPCSLSFSFRVEQSCSSHTYRVFLASSFFLCSSQALVGPVNFEGGGGGASLSDVARLIHLRRLLCMRGGGSDAGKNALSSVHLLPPTPSPCRMSVERWQQRYIADILGR
jgi:hypothetical protein